MILHPVLLVIPCLNEENHVEEVVRTLAVELCPRSLIVVADGGSTDATCRIVAALMQDEARLRLLPNPCRLQSAGVNAAVECFGQGFDWMLRADAHATYPPGYVSALLEEMLATGADSVVTTMRTEGFDPFSDAVAAAQNSKLGTGGAAHRRDNASGWIDHGHHSLFRLLTFRAVGGYDAQVSHNEDAEFDIRLAQHGGRVWLTSRTHVVYHPRNTVLGLARQYRNHGAGRARTLLTHRLRPKLRQLAPAAILPVVLVALLTPLSPILALPAVGWSGASLLGGLWLAWRAGKAHVAASGPAAMIMHLSWSVGFWSILWRWRGVSTAATASFQRRGLRLRSARHPEPAPFANRRQTSKGRRP